MACVRPRHMVLTCALGASLAFAAPSAPVLSPSAAAPETWRYASTGRVVAFGDVHGAYDALVVTLRQAGIVDAEARWAGGTATLVSVGDLVDRGPSSRRVLDLLMRLEREAAAAGGAVRVVLGNHEVMTLVGELRDASKEEVAEFAAEEDSKQRAAAAEVLVAERVAAGTAEAEARAEFAVRFPPGWFARRAAFSADGRYGAWLLSKPVAIVVDRTAFVHGGFSRLVADRDLAALNSEFHARLAQQLADIAALERAGRLDFRVNGEQRVEWLAASLPPVPSAAPPTHGASPPPPSPPPSPTDALAERAVGFDLDPFFRLYGPHWYRGFALCHEATERDVAAAARARLGVDRIVVGHTPTDDARIRSRLAGQVVLIDTGMLRAVYGGQGSALVIDANGLATVYQDGSRGTVEPDPRPVALGPVAGDAAIEEMLRSWPVLAAGQPEHRERVPVTLSSGGRTISAWFYPEHAKAGRAALERVAYRLDRALRFGLVMPTVTRKVNGVAGALQWRPGDEITAAAARTSPPTGIQWCDMPAQVNLMYAWDALIQNDGRTLETIAYTDADWLLISSDHRRAFGETMGLPAHLSGLPLSFAPEVCRRLAALDRKALREAAGRDLPGKAQKAVLARRDLVLREAGCAR